MFYDTFGRFRTRKSSYGLERSEYSLPFHALPATPRLRNYRIVLIYYKYYLITGVGGGGATQSDIVYLYRWPLIWKTSVYFRILWSTFDEQRSQKK